MTRDDHTYRRTRRQYLTDHTACVYCGDTADTIDHIIPVSKGGSMNDPTNWRASCRSCNSSRGNATHQPQPHSRVW